MYHFYRYLYIYVMLLLVVYHTGMPRMIFTTNEVAALPKILPLSDSITIKEEDGITTHHDPIQIARPFLQGEIQDYPQAIIDGIPVVTQADVKQRYDDGSVKHAILTFLIPELAANSRITVEFRNQQSGINDQTLRQSDMLHSDFNFEANIEISQAGTTALISAREMLQNGDFEYWMQGPVATSIILADHSEERKYDVGWERSAHSQLAHPVSRVDSTDIYVNDASEFSPGDPVLLEQERIAICEVDKTENKLLVGLSSCPNVDGRGIQGTTPRTYTGMAYQRTYVSTLTWKPATMQQYKSFRPIFHATFWPDSHKVRVRFIGEVSNSMAFQDQEYALTLYTGEHPQQKRYSRPVFTHRAGSRWTKEFWIGGAPSHISIDHNLAYLVKTRFFPNYDITKVIPEEIIEKAYTSWQTTSKDLYDHGFWTTRMWGTGGRPEIGPYPAWTVRWLYTGDWKMQEIAFTQADLAAAWRVHVREGDPDRFLDRARTVSGLGRPLSISSRPTIWFGRWDWYEQKETDRLNPVGSLTYDEDWRHDRAHHPDPVSPQYILSGDYWYLEEMYFWAAYMAGNTNGAAISNALGRGPTGAEGGLVNGQTRGQAWAFRSRVHAALIAPDNHPEKMYFTQLIDDAIAIWKGAKNLTHSKFHQTELWVWGKKVGFPHDRGIFPLHHWDAGTTEYAKDWNGVYSATAPWMSNFVLFALGRAEELGYPTTELKAYLGQHLIDVITHPDSNPYLAGRYTDPVLKTSDEYFDNYKDWKEAYPEKQKNATDWISWESTDTEHGYANIALTAASYVTDLPHGIKAWEFMKKNALTQPLLNHNPKWAIIPRTEEGLDHPPN